MGDLHCVRARERCAGPKKFLFSEEKRCGWGQDNYINFDGKHHWQCDLANYARNIRFREGMGFRLGQSNKTIFPNWRLSVEDLWLLWAYRLEEKQTLYYSLPYCVFQIRNWRENAENEHVCVFCVSFGVPTEINSKSICSSSQFYPWEFDLFTIATCQLNVKSESRWDICETFPFWHAAKEHRLTDWVGFKKEMWEGSLGYAIGGKGKHRNRKIWKLNNQLDLNINLSDTTFL